MNAMDTLIPHNAEAEESVLGALIIDPEMYHELADLLTTDAFYIHRNRFIWQAIARLFERKLAVDFVTLTDELGRAGTLAEIGGSAYLTGLVNNTPTSLNALYYANIVAEMYTRRQLLQAASEAAKAAGDLESPLETAKDRAEQAIFAVTVASAASDLIHTGQTASLVYDYVTGGQAARGIATGFTGLDEILTGGMRPSELIVVAGRPGMGKTGFLLSLLRYIALGTGKRAALFSLEMDKDAMVMRLLAQLSGIPLERIRNQALKDDDHAPFVAAVEQIGSGQLFIDDTPAINPNQLRSKCRRLALEQSGIDLVAVDYLQLMSGGGRGAKDQRFENRVQEVSHISRQLKLIARELSVPVIAAAQLSRGVEQRNDKQPQLSDLRESGAIEQDADIVMFLYRVEGEQKELTHLKVAKQRNGPTGDIELFFRGHLTRFDNAAKQKLDQR